MTSTAGGLVALPVRAIAGNFGSNTASHLTDPYPCNTAVTSQCIANSGTHWWYPDALLSNQLNDTRYVSDNVYEPIADIDMVEMASSSNVDLIVRDMTYAQPNAWAWTSCDPSATYGGADPLRWCRPQLLKYDLSDGSKYDSPPERKYLTCHEIGHSLGLRHSASSGSCLYPNLVTTGVLFSHDVSHLNAQYSVPPGEGPVDP